MAGTSLKGSSSAKVTFLSPHRTQGSRLNIAGTSINRLKSSGEELPRQPDCTEDGDVQWCSETQYTRKEDPNEHVLGQPRCVCTW
jgi:hypothetical protein